jgi:hypothetical protein
MEIVTSHWNEDLEWLKKSKYPVVLVDKIGASPTCIEPAYVIPNKGNEASSYIKYIIERYDTLPERIAFIHGHEDSYHYKHDKPLLDLIEAANPSYGYIPLNGWVRYYRFMNEEEVLNSPKLWDTLGLPSNIKPKIGSVLLFEPNGQFIVSRQRIHLHPKEVYEKMYEALMNEEKEWCPHEKQEIYKLTHVLENVFHIIFGENNIYFYNINWFNFNYKLVIWPGYPPPMINFINNFIANIT